MQNIKDDPLIKVITNYLTNKYKCHTIILYGSRARGESTQMSDYDIIAIRESGAMERDCSGGGKSTLLTEWSREGYKVVPEVAREIVKEQLAINGANTPWQNPQAFCEMLVIRSNDT